MERILKRIGLLGGLKTEEQHATTQCGEVVASRCSNNDSPAGDGQNVEWRDLLNNVVCATPADRGGGGGGVVGSSCAVNQDQLCCKGRDVPSGKRRQKLAERIFKLHYLDLHRMEFRPGAFRRRFCGRKKEDNALYRSNSFKFERFDRSDDTGLLQNQVVLCDDYSSPVDFVNPPRSHSLTAGLVDWTTPSPTGEPVAFVNAYCEARDAKLYLDPGAEVSKLYTTPDRDYSQPYKVRSSFTKPNDADNDDVYEDVCVSLPVPAINTCVTVIRVNDSDDSDEYAEELSQTCHEGSLRAVVRRNPSPYYYGDLFRAEIGQDCESVTSFQLGTSGEEAEHLSSLGRFLGSGFQRSPRLQGSRKSVSLDTSSSTGEVTSTKPENIIFGVTGDDTKSYKKSISLDTAEPGDKYFSKLFKKTSKTNESSFLETYNYSAHDVLCSKERSDSLLADCLLEWDSLMPPRRELRGLGLPSSCACTGGAKCVTGNREDIDDALEDRLSQKQDHGLRIESKLQQNDPRSVEEREINYDCPEVEYDCPEGEEMSGRQRQLYETAFDCKVSRSDDDLDDADRVTNHPILHNRAGILSNVRLPRPGSSQELGSGLPKDRRVVSLSRGKLVKQRPKSIASHTAIDSSSSTTTLLSRDLNDLELIDRVDDKELALSPALRGCSPSSPSTAPLPTKFHGKDEINVINSIKSAPYLPMSSPGHPRLKDLRLPVKSLRAREDLHKGIMEFKGRPSSFAPEERSEEASVRPRSMFQEGESSFKDSLVEMDVGGSDVELKGKLSDKSNISLDFSRSKVKCNETDNVLEIKGRPHRKTGVRLNFSSTESMVTSSSGGSLESIRSSTSEGNRSTSSSESQHSASLSSHSSDSIGSCSNTTMNLHRFYHHHHHQSSGGNKGGSGSRFFAHQGTKLHILSPISDKSSLEPASETSDNNRNNNSQKGSPEENEITQISPTKPSEQPWTDQGLKVKRRSPQNKNLIHLSVLQSSSSGETEIQGSDSGISIESRGTSKNHKGFAFLKLGSKITDNNVSNAQNDKQSDFADLPFDMPKLRRRRLLQQDTCTSGSTTSIDLHDLPFDMPKLRRRLQQDTMCTSGSATSVDLQDLPFDMPKLKRRLRQPQTSFDASQMSSSHFTTETDRNHEIDIIRPSLTLNLLSNKPPPQQLFGLSLNLGASTTAGEDVDALLPLERQGWYHGTITRLEAESVLRLLREGSYLVRNSESTRQDYSLSLKSARGFMHMRIQANQETGKYILGQFSKPFDNISEMIRHYSVNRLPIRGAEHMCLLHPVIEQLL